MNLKQRSAQCAVLVVVVGMLLVVPTGGPVRADALDSVPGAVTLRGPADGVLTNDTTPIFTWNDVGPQDRTGAERYQFVLTQSTTTVLDQEVAARNRCSSGVCVVMTSGSPLGDGDYSWKVRGWNSEGYGPWSSVYTLTVDATPPAAPTLTGPPDGDEVPGTTLFSWEAPPDATRYQFEYTDAPDLWESDLSWGATTHYSFSAQSLYAGEGGDTIYSLEMTTTDHTPPPMRPGTFSWRVRAGDAAGNWSEWSARTMTVTMPDPPDPTLFGSTSEQVVAGPNVSMSWIAMPYISYYQIQLAYDPDFSDLILTHNEYLGHRVTQYTPDPNIVYYWRIRARNYRGVLGPWSEVATFIVDTIPPAAPILSRPSDGATVTRTPTYIWAAADTATRYQFRYDDSPTCDRSLYTSEELTAIFYRPPTQPPGTYAWCVRARDEVGNWSAWSAPRAITLWP